MDLGERIKRVMNQKPVVVAQPRIDMNLAREQARNIAYQYGLDIAEILEDVFAKVDDSSLRLVHPVIYPSAQKILFRAWNSFGDSEDAAWTLMRRFEGLNPKMINGDDGYEVQIADRSLSYPQGFSVFSQLKDEEALQILRDGLLEALRPLHFVPSIWGRPSMSGVGMTPICIRDIHRIDLKMIP